MESITRWCQWELKAFLTRWQDVYITHKAEQTPTEPSGKTLKCSAILSHGMHEEAAKGISRNPSCLRYLGQEAGGLQWHTLEQETPRLFPGHVNWVSFGSLYFPSSPMDPFPLLFGMQCREGSLSSSDIRHSKAPISDASFNTEPVHRN